MRLLFRARTGPKRSSFEEPFNSRTRSSVEDLMRSMPGRGPLAMTAFRSARLRSSFEDHRRSLCGTRARPPLSRPARSVAHLPCERSASRLRSRILSSKTRSARRSRRALFQSSPLLITVSDPSVRRRRNSTCRITARTILFRRSPPYLRQHDAGDHLAMIPLRHAPETLRSQLLPLEVAASCRLSITFRARLSTITLVLASPRSSKEVVFRLLPYMIVARSLDRASSFDSTRPIRCEIPSCEGLPHRPVLSYRRAAPLPCSRPSFDDSVHVRHAPIAFRQPAHTGGSTRHPSMPVLTARGRRFAGCSRLFQRSPAHAAQRSRPCTSFDAHVRARRAMHAFWAHTAVPAFAAPL